VGVGYSHRRDVFSGKRVRGVGNKQTCLGMLSVAGRIVGLDGAYLAYSTVTGHDTLHPISAISGVGAAVRMGTPSGTGLWVQPCCGG
jgi:hypothetical protein